MLKGSARIHLCRTLLMVVVTASMSCNSHERVKPARFGTAWQAQQQRQIEATPPDSDASGDARTQRFNEPAAREAPAGTAIATVDGRPIPRRRAIDTLLRSHGPDLLLQLIALDTAEVLASAKGLKVEQADVNREYDRALRRLVDPLSSITTGSFDRAEAERLLETILAERNMSREEYAIIIRRNATLRAIADSEQQLTEEQLQAEFARAFGERVQIRHIQLATLTDVTRVTDQLASGKEFGDVAGRYSANVASARTLGLLEPFSASDEDVPRVLRDVAFSLEPGEVSSALRIGSWYHLLKLERRIPAEDRGFEEVRDQLRRRLGDRLAEPAMQQLYERLVRESNVTIHDPVLREAFKRKHPDLGG